MSSLTLFQFESNEVRVVNLNGDPWFVAADIARILGYPNSADFTKYLDEDECDLIHDFISHTERKIKVVSEPGLYTVLIRSDKPQAKPFRKWVTTEVLPAIRKHGYYTKVEQLPEPQQTMLPPDIRVTEFVKSLKELGINPNSPKYRKMANEIMAISPTEPQKRLSPVDHELEKSVIQIVKDLSRVQITEILSALGLKKDDKPLQMRVGSILKAHNWKKDRITPYPGAKQASFHFNPDKELNGRKLEPYYPSAEKVD